MTLIAHENKTLTMSFSVLIAHRESCMEVAFFFLFSALNIYSNNDVTSLYSLFLTAHREQINEITTYIDGSMLYGSSEEATMELREFSAGLCK